MNIREASISDLPKILKIYEYAREQMKLTGNPTQWGDNWPPDELVREDIKTHRNYVVTEGDLIYGVFAYLEGEDPTYVSIYDGEWLNEEPYGVIHRIASGGKGKGVMQLAIEFAVKKTGNVRIDTHKDNKVMNHILEKSGFIKCGIIYVHDGSDRIAYHLNKQIVYND